MALQNLPSQTQKRGHFKRALTENTAAPDVRPFFAIGTPLWMYRRQAGSYDSPGASFRLARHPFRI